MFMWLWSRNRNYNPFPPPLPPLQSARQSLLINIKKIDESESILKKREELITKTLLYGDGKFDLSCDKSIISWLNSLFLLKDSVIH